jgi:hypothetical protein
MLDVILKIDLIQNILKLFGSDLFWLEGSAKKTFQFFLLLPFLVKVVESSSDATQERNFRLMVGDTFNNVSHQLSNYMQPLLIFDKWDIFL